VVASAYQAHRAPLIDEKIPCIPQSTLTRPMGPFDWLSVHIPALDSADAKKKKSSSQPGERKWIPFLPGLVPYVRDWPSIERKTSRAPSISCKVLPI
jgi:hypothetical protein